MKNNVCYKRRIIILMGYVLLGFWCMFARLVHADTYEEYRIFPTFHEMICDEQTLDGSIVQTLGFYRIGDGGAGFYYLTSNLTEEQRKKNFEIVEKKMKICERFFTEDKRTKSQLCPYLLSESDAINVRQYGAKGDCSGDDTATFKMALDDAEENGMACYVPLGKYLITETLTIPNDMEFYGDGSKTANVNASYGGSHLCFCLREQEQIAINGSDKMYLHDMMIADESHRTDTIGVNLTEISQKVSMENIQIFQFGKYGMLLDESKGEEDTEYIFRDFFILNYDGGETSVLVIGNSGKTVFENIGMDISPSNTIESGFCFLPGERNNGEILMNSVKIEIGEAGGEIQRKIDGVVVEDGTGGTLTMMGCAFGGWAFINECKSWTGPDAPACVRLDGEMKLTMIGCNMMDLSNSTVINGTEDPLTKKKRVRFIDYQKWN